MTFNLDFMHIYFNLSLTNIYNICTTERTGHCLKEQSYCYGQEVQVLVLGSYSNRRQIGG